MKDLTTTDMVVTDTIKDYFHLYYQLDAAGNIRLYNRPMIIRCVKKRYVVHDAFSYYSVLNSRFLYILDQQQQKLIDSGIKDIVDVIQLINQEVKIGNIPSRFVCEVKVMSGIWNKARLRDYCLPAKYLELDAVYNIILGTSNKLSDEELLPLIYYKITFNESIISLIEQKFDSIQSRRIVKFFKSLCEHRGMDFDDYIDKWAARLLKESPTEGIKRK